MENNTKSTPDCGCEDGCCTPKKKPNWVKYLSILILLAAISIVAVKIVRDKKQPANQCTSASGKSCCGDSSKTAKCDTTKGSSCCPKTGK